MKIPAVAVAHVLQTLRAAISQRRAVAAFQEYVEVVVVVAQVVLQPLATMRSLSHFLVPLQLFLRPPLPTAISELADERYWFVATKCFLECVSSGSLWTSAMSSLSSVAVAVEQRFACRPAAAVRLVVAADQRLAAGLDYRRRLVAFVVADFAVMLPKSCRA
jgi:hypothetical protein